MSHESGYVWIIETAWTSHINQQIGSDMFQQFLHMRYLSVVDRRADQTQVTGCVWLLGQGKPEGLVRGRHLCNSHECTHVHGTFQCTAFSRLASHVEDFITYVAYVLVSNIVLKTRDHGGNVSMISKTEKYAWKLLLQPHSLHHFNSFYIMMHHAPSCSLALLETHMPAPSEDMVAAVTNGPAAGIATTSDAQLQIDVLDVERIG